MKKVFEEASDPFLCLPNHDDSQLIEQAFIAIQYVYLRAWTTVKDGGRPDLETTDIDQWIADNAIIAPRFRALARGLGSVTDSVFRFYIEKAIIDFSSGYIPNVKDEYGEPYTPWIFIGFPLPFDQVTIETTEDGLDWLRFGEIGPVEFGFVGAIPSYAHTVCFKRTADFSCYEVVFVGHQIDPAEGQML